MTTAEHFKHLCNKVFDIVTNMFNIEIIGIFLKEWLISIFIAIPKKKNIFENNLKQNQKQLRQF